LYKRNKAYYAQGGENEEERRIKESLEAENCASGGYAALTPNKSNITNQKKC
jgi:hypothetical protein